MNALVLTIALLSLSAADTVEVSSSPSTHLYVKTTPPEATITLDGKSVGKSEIQLDVTPGSHKVVMELAGYVAEERAVEVPEGKITRVVATLKKQGEEQIVLSHVGDKSDDMRSFADSGHAVAFERPKGAQSLIAVQLFGARYGSPEPPAEDFHIYLLDQDKKVLEHFPIPYSKAERGEVRNEKLCLKWHTFELPATELPEKFFVAFWFNAEQTKGVYVAMDKNVKESHSFAGLPDQGYRKVDGNYDWMIRAVVSSAAGKKPTRPKVATYETEKPADNESSEAAPARTWTDSSGAFTIEAEFAGTEDGKVKLKKTDGKVVSVPVDRLSAEDQEFIKNQSSKQSDAPATAETRELKLDDGSMADKWSIPRGGHGVRFEVDGDAWYVTSVSLHGSRYGMPKPPKENFQVWICDEKFKPIATFNFPYSSFTRSDPKWGNFKVKPTRVPKKFIVCFGFNPEATKGIYVSYDAEGTGNSLIGVPGKSEPRPFSKGDWLIRCKVEKRP